MSDLNKDKLKVIEGELIKSEGDNKFTFVMSDESVDRDGDIIRVEGWKLAEFKKNPVALWMHNRSSVIGRWENVRVDQATKRLLGDLVLAPDETSAFQKGINTLIRNKFIRAVSVGFRATKGEPVDPKKPYGGYVFTEQTLTETSVVSIGSNKNALAMVKSFLPDFDDSIEGECANAELERLLLEMDKSPSAEQDDSEGSEEEKNPPEPVPTPNVDSAKAFLDSLETK